MKITKALTVCLSLCLTCQVSLCAETQTKKKRQVLADGQRKRAGSPISTKNDRTQRTYKDFTFETPTNEISMGAEETPAGLLKTFSFSKKGTEITRIYTHLGTLIALQEYDPTSGRISMANHEEDGTWRLEWTNQEDNPIRGSIYHIDQDLYAFITTDGVDLKFTVDEGGTLTLLQGLSDSYDFSKEDLDLINLISEIGL